VPFRAPIPGGDEAPWALTGRPIWNKRLIEETQRYPALDLGPWQAALGESWPSRPGNCIRPTLSSGMTRAWAPGSRSIRSW
jgi:hypothetical protein